MHNVLKVKNLSVKYDNHLALDTISFTIPKGVRACIIGPNGAGKSTLMKAVLKLIPFSSGKVEILGGKLKDKRNDLAYVPQTSDVNWNFPTTVEDLVLMGITAKRFGWSRISQESKMKVEKALETMQLTDIAKRQISQLSGGQKQRVFLARAIAQNAELYFFDEPLAGVDMKTEKIIMQEMKALQKAGKTSITVHHDLTTAADYFDYVVFLNKKLIAIGPIDSTFTSENIDLTYYGEIKKHEKVKELNFISSDKENPTQKEVIGNG